MALTESHCAREHVSIYIHVALARAVDLLAGGVAAMMHTLRPTFLFCRFPNTLLVRFIGWKRGFPIN